MAGFVASPNTIKVLVHWSIHGRGQLNVLHGEYTIAGPLSPNIAQNIWNTVSASLVSTNYTALLCQSTSLVAIGVLDIRTAAIPELISTGTAVPGLNTARPTPDATSFVLTLRTGLTGKAHRGRIYTLGWGSDTVQADGTCTQANANIAVAWYNSLSAAMSAQGATLAVRSTAKPDRPSKPGGTLPAKPYEITPVTSIVARDLIFDTNRRRTDTLHR